jgi:hypothetical protein
MIPATGLRRSMVIKKDGRLHSVFSATHKTFDNLHGFVRKTLHLKLRTGLGLAALTLLLAGGLASLTLSTTSAPGKGEGRVSVIRIPGADEVIKARLGDEGTTHLLLSTADGPQYAKSQDGGVSFSTRVPVVEASSRKPGLEFHGEDLAVSKDGRVHVILSSNAWKLKLPQEEWALFYTGLAPGAKGFSPLRNLNRKPSEGFSVAADQRGNVSAAFLSGKLFSMVSHDNGETFTASRELDATFNPCDCCTTSTAYGPDGKLALLYREETNNERDMYLVLWDQIGGSPVSRTRISSTLWHIEGCPMSAYSINGTDTGYVAAWPTKGQVYFARLNRSGAVLPPGEIRTPGTVGMRSRLVVLTAADGTTLVAWKDKGGLGWQLYDAKGQPQGTPGSSASAGSGAAGVVLTNGRFVLFS